MRTLVLFKSVSSLETTPLQSPYNSREDTALLIVKPKLSNVQITTYINREAGVRTQNIATSNTRSQKPALTFLSTIIPTVQQRYMVLPQLSTESGGEKLGVDTPVSCHFYKPRPELHKDRVRA